MELRAVLVAFATVFLAELGDKTQLAALALATRSGTRWSVFLGSSLALVASAGLAVLAGGFLGTRLPPQVLRTAAGVLFIAVGIWTLLRPAT